MRRIVFSIAWIIATTAIAEAQLPVSIPGTVTIGNPPYVADGASWTAGSTLVVPAGCVRDDAAPTIGASTADGDIGVIRCGPNGEQYFRLVNSDGTFPTLATDGTVGSAAPTTGPQSLAAYRSSLSGTANVSDGASVRTLSDGMGRLLDAGPCPGGNIIDGQATVTDGSSTSVIGAGGANVVNEVWEIDFGNSSATYVNVDIRDGTAGAVLGTYSIPPGGAISRALRTPIRSTANTALAADPSASATSIFVSLRGCTTR